MSTAALIADLTAMLAAQPGARATPLPSAPGVTTWKVMGKLFAIVESRRIDALILTCDPWEVDILRERYAGVGHRSHLDRRFWICIDLAADVPAAEVHRLAARSYERVCAKLTRQQRADLAALPDR